MIALVLTMSAVPVFATPDTAAKQAEAQRVKAQIDELDAQVEVAAERYNEANAAHQQILSDIQVTEEKLAATNARIGVLQQHLSVRANSMYRSGPMGFLEVLLNAEDFEQFATTWDLLRDMNEQEATNVAELKDARQEAEAAKAELDEQEAAAHEIVDQMAANKASIESQLAEREGMLRGIESEIAAIEAAERAREAAAARTAASRASTSVRTFPPPTRAARGEVVNIAMKYLGAPYRWGAAGPNAFDCSGFTMFVYAQVGVSLPHSSRAQINSGQRVSMSDLQAGDLVFFGSPIHHVGIYIGGGQYIHAPHTGDVVRIAPLNRGDYAGACRP